MKINGVGPVKTYSTPYSESAETKQIRKLSQEINHINNQTQYIKDYGVKPPQTQFNYNTNLKKLNTY